LYPVGEAPASVLRSPPDGGSTSTRAARKPSQVRRPREADRPFPAGRRRRPARRASRCRCPEGNRRANPSWASVQPLASGREATARASGRPLRVGLSRRLPPRALHHEQQSSPFTQHCKVELSATDVATVRKLSARSGGRSWRVACSFTPARGVPRAGPSIRIRAVTSPGRSGSARAIAGRNPRQ
jgi:hypothetical protein